MSGSFDISLVIATYCIAVAAVGCALELGIRSRHFDTARRLVWLAIGSAAIGTGLTSMHQVGELAIGLGLASGATPLHGTLAWMASFVTALLAAVMIGRSRLELAPLPKLGSALLIGAMLTTMQFSSTGSSGQALDGAQAGLGNGLTIAFTALAMMTGALVAMLLDQRMVDGRVVRDLEQAEVERVHRLAYYDSVTGLPNRSLFTEKLLKQLVDANHRDTGPFGLVYAELRDFRVLLQRHGDERMNRVLKTLTERLKQEISADDVLARLSYDGLILFVREQGERDTAAMVAKLSALLSTPVTDGGDSIRFTWGIGHSRFPEHGQSTQALIRAATTVQRQTGSEPLTLASSSRPRYALAS